MKRFVLLLGVILLILYGCAETQEDIPTVEDLAKDLAGALEKLLSNDLSTISKYVKVTDEFSLKPEADKYLNALKDTFSTLGNKVEFVGIQETKAATPVYSFDINTDKPESVEKVYLMNILLVQTQGTLTISKKLFVLPFITLNGETNKIYLAVIYKDDDQVKIFPNPITP
ncbi:MAG: hypothetical protein WHT65_00190 [Pseudothermotoga sp.]